MAIFKTKYRIDFDIFRNMSRKTQDSSAVSENNKQNLMRCGTHETLRAIRSQGVGGGGGGVGRDV